MDRFRTVAYAGLTSVPAMAKLMSLSKRPRSLRVGARECVTTCAPESLQLAFRVPSNPEGAIFRMTKNIDVHWHHVPKPFVKAVADGKVPIKGRYQLDENGEPEIKVDLGFREFTQELPPELSEVDAAVEHMDRVGLDVVAASVAPPLMQYLARAEDGLKISQVMNDSMAEATSAHPKRFRPLANVPLQDPDAPAKELPRAMLE